MRNIRLKVTRDTNTVYSVSVAPWEQPVYEAVYPVGSVQPTGETQEVSKPYPEAGLEFDRLMRKFGADPKTGIPFVVSAYGAERAGIRALEDEITKAKKADQAAQRAAAPRRGRRAASGADPLTA
ncbi:MAG: hypothetical protein KGL39_09480 [Patescibacteria group bacterium]|nr:hypothetical protein [Patescibacteria group bacterium]